MISAQVDDGEIFDTEKLKKTADFLIQNEVRNLIVDLGDLDYLYSDGINALIGVNKKMIQVAGRLGLLVRTAKVREIAESAGLDNMMKIYGSEEEVKKDSQLIAPSAPKAPAAKAPTAPVVPPVKEKKEEPKLDAAFEAKIEKILTPEDGSSPFTKKEDLLPLKEEDSKKEEESKTESLSETEEIEALSAGNEDTTTSAFADLGLSSSAASDSDESNSSEKDGDAASRGRLGPQDRLRNPSGRVKPVKRTGGRQWDESEEANTGLIITDDTVSGEVVKKEDNVPRPNAYNLVDEKSSSKLPTIIIGIILLAIVGGGFYWVKNNTDLLKGKSQAETEKPYIPDADKETMFDTSTVDSSVLQRAADDSTAEEESFIEDEVVEKETPKPKPKKEVSRSESSKPKSTPRPVERRESSTPQGETIRITSSPSGAEVMVNFAKKGETPITVELQNKTNIVIVKKEGYKKYQTKISRDDHESSLNVDLESESGSEPKREVSRPVERSKPEPEPEPEPEPSGPAKIRVTSNPSGADVLVNFSNKGKTPLTITLNNNSNTIIVNKSGYKKYQTKLLNTTTKTSLDVDLEPERTEAPKASTPKPEPVEEARPDPKPEPKASTPSSAPVGTGPIGRVFLASRPPGAEVEVDGKKMGFQTPHWLEVPSGAHNIKLTKGAQSATKQIMVRPGKNKSEYIILK